MTSRPRARSRARSIGVIGGVLAIALLYVVVIVLYAAGGRIEHAEASSGGEGVPLELTLTPVDIDGAASTMSVRINPTDLGSYSSDDFSMDEAVHVLVTGTNGARTIEYGADEVVGAETVALTLDGFIEQWPFDRYTAETLIAPMRVDADGQGVPIPYVLTADGRVPGWNVVAEAVSTVSVVTEDGTITLLGVQFTITRAASTVAFGLVLLTLMVIAPVLVLTAAITVYRGRRKIEVTMLGMAWLPPNPRAMPTRRVTHPMLMRVQTAAPAEASELRPAAGRVPEATGLRLEPVVDRVIDEPRDGQQHRGRDPPPEKARDIDAGQHHDEHPDDRGDDEHDARLNEFRASPGEVTARPLGASSQPASQGRLDPDRRQREHHCRPQHRPADRDLRHDQSDQQQDGDVEDVKRHESDQPGAHGSTLPQMPSCRRARSDAVSGPAVPTIHGGGGRFEPPTSRSRLECVVR